MTVNSRIGAPNLNREAAPEREPAQQVVQQSYERYQPKDERADLESLIFFGRIEREFDINGKRVLMHTLSNEEQKISLKLMSKKNFDGSILDTLELRDAVLALAIDSINDVPLESLYKGEGVNDLDARVRMVASWQPLLSELLYDKYQSLVDDSKKAIFGEPDKESGEIDVEKGQENIKN